MDPSAGQLRGKSVKIMRRHFKMINIFSGTNVTFCLFSKQPDELYLTTETKQGDNIAIIFR